MDSKSRIWKVGDLVTVASGSNSHNQVFFILLKRKFALDENNEIDWWEVYQFDCLGKNQVINLNLGRPEYFELISRVD